MTQQPLTGAEPAHGPGGAQATNLSGPPGARAETVLEEAQRIIGGQRREDYGGPLESFSDIAAGWSMVLGVEVTAEQVGLCMVQLKVARAKNGGFHRDSFVDIAGYAGCMELVAEARAAEAAALERAAAGLVGESFEAVEAADPPSPRPVLGVGDLVAVRAEARVPRPPGSPRRTVSSVSGRSTSLKDGLPLVALSGSERWYSQSDLTRLATAGQLSADLRPGEEVVCVDPGGKRRLVEGRRYRVASIVGNGLLLVEGLSAAYSHSRFVPARGAGL